MSGAALALRPARREDAPDLARLVNLAGEGLPFLLWSGGAAPGEDPWEVGRRRAERDAGAFSWRNARVAECGGQVAGAMVAYLTEPEPVDDLAPFLRPLQALENLVPGTLYVNVLACYPDFRRRGVGRALLASLSGDAAPKGHSVIVADRNHAAAALYHAEGFRERARRPLAHPPGWTSDSENWLLLTRD